MKRKQEISASEGEGYLLKLSCQSAEWQVKGQSWCRLGGWQHFPPEMSWRLSLAPMTFSPFRYKYCCPVGHSVYPSFFMSSPNWGDGLHLLFSEITLGITSKKLVIRNNKSIPNIWFLGNWRTQGQNLELTLLILFSVNKIVCSTLSTSTFKQRANCTLA